MNKNGLYELQSTESSKRLLGKIGREQVVTQESLHSSDCLVFGLQIAVTVLLPTDLLPSGMAGALLALPHKPVTSHILTY